MTNSTNATGGNLLKNVAIAAALITLAVIGLRTVANDEVWTHLASGRAIAESGILHPDTFSWSHAETPWVNTSWLYDLMLYRIWQLGGAPLAVLLNILAVIAAFIMLLPLARRWATTTATALALILCAWILAPVFLLSPGVFSLFFCALFIMIFSGKFRPVIAIPILLTAQLLWTNISSTFLWGPVICIVFLAQNYFAKGRKGKSLAASMKFTSLLILTAAVLLITLFNPYLTGLHAAVLASLGNPSAQYVTSWISPFSDQFAPSLLRYLPIFALIIGAGGLVMQKEKLPIGMTALAIMTAFLVIRSLYFSPLFAIMAFPFLAMSIHTVVESMSGKSSSRLIPAWASEVLVLLLALFTLTYFITNAYYNRYGYAGGIGFGIAAHAFPTDEAVATLNTKGMPERTINTIQDGGYLAWKQPNRRIFVDSRISLYPLDFYRNLAAGLNGTAWKDFYTQWEPEAMVLNTTYRQAPLTAKMLAMNGWALIYFDGLTAIYLPRTPANKSIIDNQDLKRKGLSILSDRISAYRDSLGGVLAQPPPADLIGGGALLLANGNYKHAAGIYSLLTRGVPEMATVWLNLGRCQLELGEAEKAAASLQEAVRRAPRDSIAWLNLSLAQEKCGRPDEAARAFDQVKKLNPDLAKAFQESKEAEADQAGAASI
ncbi:MAG: tetratricopeptide repeat protein [Kiritimatiellae bacterium]|nr:tetratricopeptide repeat protein [Kiritimatiellia bacterium]MDD4737242.1 tetratricopeptide repeat protein [Kiritimatiellia bacterium]